MLLVELGLFNDPVLLELHPIGDQPHGLLEDQLLALIGVLQVLQGGVDLALELIILLLVGGLLGIQLTGDPALLLGQCALLQSLQPGLLGLAGEILLLQVTTDGALLDAGVKFVGLLLVGLSAGKVSLVGIQGAGDLTLLLAQATLVGAALAGQVGLGVGAGVLLGDVEARLDGRGPAGGGSHAGVQATLGVHRLLGLQLVELDVGIVVGEQVGEPLLHQGVVGDERLGRVKRGLGVVKIHPGALQVEPVLLKTQAAGRRRIVVKSAGLRIHVGRVEAHVAGVDILILKVVRRILVGARGRARGHVRASVLVRLNAADADVVHCLFLCSSAAW